MNIIAALQYLFPDASPITDYEVWDDGAGPYIKRWNLPAPIPTDAELLEAEPLGLGNQQAKAIITSLESQITLRRLREALLGKDGGWLANLENQIISERAKIRKKV